MEKKYWVVASIHTLGGCHNFVSKKRMTAEEIEGLRAKYPRIVVDVPEFGVQFDADVICGLMHSTASREDVVKVCKKLNESGQAWSSWFSRLQEEEE